MKTYSWRVDGQERWEWEETGKIHVYDLSGVSDNEIEKVISIINEIIDEFALPLSVKKGDILKKDDLKQLIQQCSNKDEIYFYYLEEELNKKRRETEFFPCGVIIVISNTCNIEECGHERAVYGCSTSEGLMVLKRKYIDIATKHEFGHMIGLGHHHENCVMEFSCIPDEFCEKCRDQIKDMWEL